MVSHIGYLTGLETTFNTDARSYHPHLNVLMLYSKCVPQDKLMYNWSDLTSTAFNHFEPRDEPPETRIRDVHIKKVQSGSSLQTAQQSISNAISYISKPVTMPEAEAFGEYFLATKDFNLTRTYGVIRRWGISALPHYLDIKEYKSADAGGASEVQAERVAAEEVKAGQRKLVARREAYSMAERADEAARRVDAVVAELECIVCSSKVPADEIFFASLMCERCAAASDEEGGAVAVNQH
jgi:hypothetical protein